MPFTGAFEFVLCPRCRAVIHGARAARASPALVAASPPAYTVPSAQAIQEGAPRAPPPEHFVRRVARLAAMAGTVTTAFLLVSNLAALFIGIPIALAYSATAPDRFVGIFVVIPLRVDLLYLTGEAAGVWYLLLAAAIAASFAWLAYRHGPGAWGKLQVALQGGGTPTLDEPNAFFALGRVFATAVFVTIAVEIVATLFGQTPRTPVSLEEAPLGANLVVLAHASVWEELVTRVLFLGLPLLVIHALGRGTVERPAYRYLLGGRFTIDGPALTLVFFQAAEFGLAHAPGWDLWKVPSAFIVGLGSGFLFLRYGLAASVALHFLLDYLSIPIALSEGTGYPALAVAAFLAVLIVGVVTTVRYVFVVREIVMAGRVPEYLGGPAPAPPRGAMPQGAQGAPGEPAAPSERTWPPGGRG